MYDKLDEYFLKLLNEYKYFKIMFTNTKILQFQTFSSRSHCSENIIRHILNQFKDIYFFSL